MRLTVALMSMMCCAPAVVQAVQQEARAVRLDGQVPIIDGRLSEAIWAAAPAITGFLQRNPIEGATPSESTEVRFAYTDRDLFVGFRGFDRQPHRVYGRLVRRDQRTASDNFSLFIDSYHDRRTAFEFTFNPSGARRDVFIYEDGLGRDESWDPVYDWATRRDSLGWTVELRIPFSQLRYAQRDSLEFGVRLRRSINRRNEELNWPFFPRDQAGEVSRYGLLNGFTQLPAPGRMELLPYTAGSATFEPGVTGDPFSGRTSSVRAGGDLKLGITSGLTLDMTANPDFGQVEADAAVVNLTEFEQFFPEKRPFFIEGTNLFQFGLDPGNANQFGRGRSSQEGLVYTRRVGRAPQVSPDDAGGYAESINQTTILTAAKVSGQLGNGWSLGLMQAITAKELADIVDSLGVSGESPIEPLSGYTVLRLQRSLNQGRLTYGVIATGMLRDLDNEAAFTELHSATASGGLDIRGRFGRDRYEFDLAFMGSHVAGSEEALLETQRSSARYYQRPDQTHARLDSSRTSLEGLAGYARLAKTVGFVTWDARYSTRTPGFEVNDLGFLRQSDIHEQRAQVELRWLRPGTVFRQFEWRVQEQAQFTYGWERTRTAVDTRLEGQFLNYWSLNATVQREFSSLSPRLLRGGPAVLEPGRWGIRAGGRTDFRRPFWVTVNVDRTIENESDARRWGASVRVGVRPPGRFSLRLDTRASWGTNDRQYITQEVAGDSTYYVLGRLDRREIAFTLRADLAITPRLSLELYAEPFVSAGTYEPLRLALDPRAPAYDDRFDPLESDRITRPGDGASVDVDVDRDGTVDFSFDDPDFRRVSFRTNAVLRWEFRPGSTLFLVWQQNRHDSVDDGTLDVSDAFRDAFGASGSHVLALKVTYWIGF